MFNKVHDGTPQDLASGYMSGKLLLKLDSVAFILVNHTAKNFAFLDQPVNSRRADELLPHPRAAAVHGGHARQVQGLRRAAPAGELKCKVL